MTKYIYKEKAHIKNKDAYIDAYQSSINDRDLFWAQKAEQINWIKKWDKISDVDYEKANKFFYRLN